MGQHDLEAGVEIGDFRIERRLGAGGMGIVYQARQVSLDRPVALKILGAALTREADRMRFQREAQAVAKLNHPGIAGVYFIGQDRHVCYMAMEFVDGLSLREIIDRLAASRDAGLTLDLALQAPQAEESEAREIRFDQPTPAYTGGGDDPPDGALSGQHEPTSEAKQLFLSRSYLKRCCEIAVEAAQALAHTHERGVVHRDVKPENILIDRQGRVRLIDFGVARFFEDGTLTNTGALVGTPLYMSPEQVTGRLDVDHRTDVYSLGMVLYELLTLARAIAAPTREGVLRKVVTKAMPPASWQNTAIPRDLEGVLHKAIAKDPDDRYQTAADFAADLKRWLDGKPVAALPYRYRLDRREIKAERPAGIMVLAFAHFLVATFSAIAASVCIFSFVLLSNEELMRSSVQSRDEPVSVQQVRAALVAFSAGFVLLTAYVLSVGFGLLSANRWARWVSVGVSAAIAAWMLFEMIRRLFRGRVDLEMGFQAVILALVGSAIAYLLRRSTRDWFRLAAQVRTEHGRASAVSG
jgi:eukaryotic-like serine/threonine-protein kinase